MGPSEIAYKRPALGDGLLRATWQRFHGTAAWCAIRSMKVIQREGLAALIFREGFFGEAAELAPRGGELLRPLGLILKFGENLGCNGILLILRKLRNPFQSFLEQLRHTLNLPDEHGVCNKGG